MFTCMRLQPLPIYLPQRITNNNFITWPGLATTLVQTMVLPTATSKSYLHQERKNLQSTKIRENPPVNDTSAKDNNQKSHNLYCALEKIVPTGRAFSDLIGRFPCHSS